MEGGAPRVALLVVSLGVLLVHLVLELVELCEERGVRGVQWTIDNRIRTTATPQHSRLPDASPRPVCPPGAVALSRCLGY